jgi:3-isopropylmalate dehydrogenase
MRSTLNLAVIGGDGIGPEVTAEAIATLRAAVGSDVEITTTDYDLGAAHFLATGEVLSDETLDKLSRHDDIVLGAVGGDPTDPRLAGGIIERGLLLKLRFAFDQGVNVRPTVLFPGLESPLKNPGVIDFVVIREGTEGPYVGNGGVLRQGTPFEIANEVSVNTAHGVERVVRFAFEKARTRRKKLTLVHKTNVLVHAGGLWSRIVREVGSEVPDVSVDYLHIDATMIFMVSDPARFDVIVTDNLFGDIITDLAGAVGGGIGTATSANLNTAGTFPSMFEPVHGSAPDIAGQGIADPTAAIMSMALLLEHHGLKVAANRISQAVGSYLADRNQSARVLASRTQKIGAAIRQRLGDSARTLPINVDTREGRDA